MVGENVGNEGSLGLENEYELSLRVMTIRQRVELARDRIVRGSVRADMTDEEWNALFLKELTALTSDIVISCAMTLEQEAGGSPPGEWDESTRRLYDVFLGMAGQFLRDKQGEHEGMPVVASIDIEEDGSIDVPSGGLTN